MSRTRRDMRDQLLRELSQRTAANIELNTAEDLYRALLPGPPLPTQKEVLDSDLQFIAYMGSAGSGKTLVGCAFILIRAMLNPGSFSVIGRNLLKDVMITTKVEFDKMMARLPPGLKVREVSSPVPTVEIQAMGGGVSTIIFTGVSEANWASYNISFAFVEEADECVESQIDELRTRFRGPTVVDGGQQMLMCFNGPDKTHWLYTACTGKDHRERPHKDKKQWVQRLFRPQQYENKKNLPTGYYEKMDSLPEDLRIRRQVGDWGLILPGDRVYREFNTQLHVRKGLGKLVDPDLPLDCLWDFGYRRPAFIARQLVGAQWLHVFAHLGENQEIKPFASQMMGALKQKFPMVTKFRHYGDPAAVQKKDTGSTLQHLAEVGITLFYKRSSIEDGLRAGRTLLKQLNEDGEPLMLFDAEEAAILVSTLAKGYRFPERKRDDAELKLEPKKDGTYDHIADAWRYGNIFLDSEGGEYGGNIPDSLEPGHMRQFADLDSLESQE